jgi:hypothetical protein
LHRLFWFQAHWHALALVNESYGAIDAEFHAVAGQSVFRAYGSRLQNSEATKQDLEKIWGGRLQCRNGYGRADAPTLALAMRYVIVICAITFFLIWDGLYNQGRYLDSTVRELSRVVRYVTGKV